MRAGIAAAHAGYKENEAELTTSQCKRILNSIAEFDKCTIILTGGEPMERSDIYSLIQLRQRGGPAHGDGDVRLYD